MHGERGGGRHMGKGEKKTVLYICTKYLSRYLWFYVCDCCCACIWVQVNNGTVTTDPQLKHATPTVSQECTHRFMAASISRGVSVFRRDAMHDSGQACLCKSRSQDTEYFSEPQ